MAKFFHFFKLIPRPFLLSILSGVFIGTSYIPFSGWFLLICFAPIWMATLQLNDEKASLKKIFFIGWIAQFILTLIGFNWIYYVASEFGQLPWIVCVLSLFLFAAFMHLYIPFSLVIAVWLVRKLKIISELTLLIILALTLALLERIWPSIFEWNLAYTLLWIKLPLYQWADTVGFWGLSTFLYLIQALICWAGLGWAQQKQKTIAILAAVLVFLFLFNGLGILKQRAWAQTDQTVQFGVIQGNVGNLDKLLAEKQQSFHEHILGIYMGLTDALLASHPETEIVIWPETAMPFALDPAFHPQPAPQKLLQQVKSWKRPLITGAYSVDPMRHDHLGYQLTSNSVFFISPDLKLIGDAYSKSELLVFGEYMPLGEQFPFLYKLFPFVGVYKQGDGPTVSSIQLSGKNLRLGAEICYESLKPSFSRALADKGSQLIFNVTNDAWFGWWAEPYQHGTMTLGRAIEIRRPMVRATNSGISSVILADGTQLESSGIDQTWSHTYEVRYLENPPLTFYSRYGHYDWIFWLALLLGLLAYHYRKGLHVHN